MTKRLSRLLIVAAGLAVVAGPGAAAAAPPSYVVIVNAANPAASLSKAELGRIFLKKVTAWPDSKPIVAVDQSRTAAVRQDFSVDVHQKDADAISAHWQVLVFSGRDVPPRIVRSDDEVIEFVKDNPGAIGYVSSKAALNAGVKKVTVN
jgi:ABC-type phosphate transport system substrate-binding protein